MIDSERIIITLPYKANTAISVDNFTYTSGSANMIQKYDWVSGDETHTFEGHLGPVTQMVVKDNLLYSGSWDKRIRVWDLLEEKCIKLFKGHIDFVTCLSFDKVDTDVLYSGGADKELRCWNLPNGDVKWINHDHGRQVNAILSCEEGFIITAGSDNHLRTIRSDNGNQIKGNRCHETVIWCLDRWKDFIWSGSGDKDVRCWRLEDLLDTTFEDPRFVYEFRFDQPVRSLKVSESEKYLVLGLEDGTCVVYDLTKDDPVEINRFRHHRDVITNIEIFEDIGKFLTSSLDWSIQKHNLLRTVKDDDYESDRSVDLSDLEDYDPEIEAIQQERLRAMLMHDLKMN
eukprot:TRINITY_DN1984_c0_g1_i1.p2 TRINITY_DN1984_c0_g1~~TRINITY_DN1984_c0_g1_i1.p2  ORF type:complete len:343 (+),score=83.49 TRINITY_DN1984_c0_g1_i1:1255-2283(+)